MEKHGESVDSVPTVPSEDDIWCVRVPENRILGLLASAPIPPAGGDGTADD